LDEGKEKLGGGKRKRERQKKGRNVGKGN